MTANGLSQLNENRSYNDVSPYSMFNGTIINQNEFPETSEIMLEFSNAGGKERREAKRMKRTEKKDSRQRRIEERHQSRLEAKKSRQDARKERINIKKSEADTQQKLAESLSQPSGDDALLNTLKSASAPAPESKGMSKPLKIGLIVGGVVVVGVVVFLLIRKKRKK